MRPHPRREAEEGRFTITESYLAVLTSDFAADVAQGLSRRRKTLSCRYLYDAAGSELFEAICDLPEYYLTRAEQQILERRAAAIAGAVPAGATVVELGSGSARKTRLILEAFLARAGRVRYVPIDISQSMLRESSLALLRDYPGLEISAIAAEYQAGLRALERERERPKLVVWLGSNVGNFTRAAAARFLSGVRQTLAPDDRLLVGVDLRKDRAVLEAAYDDAAGVTGRFNLNLLARINRELGGRFDLATFRHRARYDERRGCVNMHLVSERAQTVPIAAVGLAVRFAAGEGIHTESSYKYAPAEIEALARASRLSIVASWLDAGRRFSLNLFAPTAG
jgi:L-histidine Nalpha-methyltransferase